MNPPTPEPSVKKKRDCSWLLLGLTLTAFLVPLWFLSYITIYTEGEVSQVLFKVLIGFIALCAAVGFYRRLWGMWIVIVLGGVLISWETYQVRKWAMLQEEVGKLVNYVEGYHSKHGNYPADISEYEFRHETLKSHVHKYRVDGRQGFYFEYFMNTPSTTYRYTPKGGHAYYPD